MQSLIHGNFEGRPRRRPTRWSAPRRRSPRRWGRCSAGFVTTYLSWRVGFLLEVVVIAVVLLADQARPRRALHRASGGRRGRRRAVRRGHGWRRARHPRLAGGRRVRRGHHRGRRDRARARSPTGWCGASAQGKPTLLDPELFGCPHFRLGITQQMLQQITLGGAMIALPIFLQMTLEYNAMQAGLSLAPLSLTHVRRGRPRRAEGRATAAAPRSSARASRSSTVGMALIVPLVPRGGLRLASRDPAGDRRLRARPAGLPAQQLHARPDRRGAGQRGRGGELGRRVLRPVVRAGGGRWHHAGRALASASPT